MTRIDDVKQELKALNELGVISKGKLNKAKKYIDSHVEEIEKMLDCDSVSNVADLVMDLA